MEGIGVLAEKLEAIGLNVNQVKTKDGAKSPGPCTAPYTSFRLRHAAYLVTGYRLQLA